MQFLRTLFWVVLAVVAMIFATKNWTTTQLNLWGGIVADVKLPVLLLVVFLIGLLPPTILYHASRWRMRRRIDGAERLIAELRPVAGGPATVEPVTDAAALPFTAAAVAVPGAPPGAGRTGGPAA